MTECLQLTLYQHGSMTLQARDGPVTLTPNSGAQVGFTLAPRDFNDCCNPKVDQWRQNLRTVDCTTAWLDAVNPCDPSRRVVDLSSATFMDDISRIQIFAAPPSVAEVVFKMNTGHTRCWKSRWGSEKGLRGVACSEAHLLGPFLKADGHITAEIGRRGDRARRGWRQCGRFWKAKVPKRVKRLMLSSFVQGRHCRD